MVNVVTRAANGIPLTHEQVDNNFIVLAAAVNNVGADVLAEAVAAKDEAVSASLSAQGSATNAAISANSASISSGNAANSAESAESSANASQISATAASNSVAALGSDTGATLLRWIRSSVGAVSTTLQKWMDWNTVFLFDFLTSSQISDCKSGIKNDLTSQIQKALNASVGKRLIINGSAIYGVSFVGWGTNGLALDVPSNIVIEFEPGALIEAMPHNAIIYQIMRVWDRENVTIIRPYLNGRKDLNSATSGEFGMGIDIRGGNNIRVTDNSSLNTWGDAIYIGRSTNTGSPKNVRIDRPFADGCRRQGMSVVSANGLTVLNPVWQNIGGTSPSAGLDIEPDDGLDELLGISIINPRTINCTTGIQIQLANWVSATQKVADIYIENHSDQGSTVAYSPGGANTNNGANKMVGRIISENPVWSENSNVAFISSEHDLLGPDIYVIRPTVINCNRSGQSSPNYGSPFSVLRDTGSVLTYPIGAVHIVEPSIVLTSGSIPRIFSFQDVVGGISKVGDCHFIDPVSLSGMPDKRGNFQGTGVVSDKYLEWEYSVAGSGTLDFNYTATIVTPNSSVSLTLAGATSFIAKSPDIVIKNGGSNSCIVATATGGNFVGSAVGIRLQSPSNSMGSYIRLRPLGADIWLIVEKCGVWNLI